MNTLVLNLMPGLMMKYEYVDSLLKWLKEAIDEVEKHSSTIGYPCIESVLLTALEKAAQDVHSSELLRLVLKLRKLNECLEKANQNPTNTGIVLDTAAALKKQLPALDTEIRAKVARYTRRSLFLFMTLIATLLAPYIALIVGTCL